MTLWKSVDTTSLLPEIGMMQGRAAITRVRDYIADRLAQHHNIALPLAFTLIGYGFLFHILNSGHVGLHLM